MMTSSFINGTIKLPIEKSDEGVEQYDDFTFAEMGLSYPLLLNANKPKPVMVANPLFSEEAVMKAQQKMIETGAIAGEPDPATVEAVQIDRLEFTYQIVWQETVLSERIEAREAAQKAAEEAAAQPAEDTVASTQ